MKQDLKKVDDIEAKEDDINVKPKATARVSIFKLFSFAEPLDIFFMVVGTIGALITGISIPFFNILFGRILDGLNGNTSTSAFAGKINTIVFAFVGVAGINLFTAYFQVALWSLTGERQTQKLREAYVRSVLSQEVGWFDTVGAAELATKVAEIVGQIEDGIGRKVGDMIQYLAQFIGSYVIGFYLSWKLTVVLLASFPLIAGAGAFMISAITEGLQKALSQYTKAGGLATETLSSIRTVTALNAQVEAINRYRVFLLDAMQIGIRKGLNIGIGNGALFGACFGTYALGFWYGAKLIADDLQSGCTDNCLSGGVVLAVFFSIIVGSMAMGQIAPPLTAFTSALAAAVPLFEVINRKPQIDGLSEEGNIPLEKQIKGKIEIENISFSYPSRPHIQVARGYSLTIEPGETVALVGPSGCGKSTVVNLLLRFYDPQSGTVKLDGLDIKTLNTRWLRSQMGYVGQEPVLFSGTIADNIAYGIDKQIAAKSGQLSTPEVSMEEIIAAAKLSNAHDFISSFPNGYQTDVGSNGVALSGGQKQRIAIARALIRKPAVLLLDEATSALDATSERLVQESIDSLQRSRHQTTVIIAHRLSTIRNADKIAVINQGVIVELGTHDELLSRHGLYADLVSLQMSTGLDAEIMASNRAIASANSLQKLTDMDSTTALPSDRFDSNAANDISLPDIYSKSGHSIVKESAKTQPLVKGNQPEVSSKDIKEADIDKEEAKKLRARIWALVYQNKIWFSLSLLGAAAFGAIFPMWGYILARTQTSFYFTNPQRIKTYAANLSYIYVSLGINSLVSSIFMFWGIAQVGERISAQFRSAMFEALLRTDVGFFDREENNIGALTTRLADDSRIVSKATGYAFARQVQAFVTLVLGVALGFQATWKVSLVVLAAFPLNIIASSIQLQAISGQQYDNDNTTAAEVKKQPSVKNPELDDDEQVIAQQVPVNKSSGGHGALISTAFTHMRTISAFSLQFHVAREYNALTQAITNKRMERAHIAGFGFGGAQTSLFLTYALLFWYGSTLIQSGEITFQELMQSILCLMLGALGLGQALGDIGDQKEGLQAAKRIFKAIDEGAMSPIDGLSDKGEILTERSKGRIDLEGVDFTYPTRPNIRVCKDYNLSIEPGQVVALVGPSGSGKSTIINLLLRFYDPSSGQLLLDGTNIRDLNVKWLRSQIGYVGQEPVLFSGTVAENIARGRPKLPSASSLLPIEQAMKQSDDKVGIFGLSALDDSLKEVTKEDYKLVPQEDEDHATSVLSSIEATSASDRLARIHEQAERESPILGVPADIIEAAILSNAHNFIKSFPNGYHTEVGEGSILVSGGQKQRIAIARALIRKPSILLLDEATSALDSASEQLVQASIDLLQSSKAQTTIVIAHRLSTIRHADKIAVINHGKVVEIGTHDQLLALDGLYTQLWSKQGGEKSST